MIYVFVLHYNSTKLISDYQIKAHFFDTFFSIILVAMKLNFKFLLIAILFIAISVSCTTATTTDTESETIEKATPEIGIAITLESALEVDIGQLGLTNVDEMYAMNIQHDADIEYIGQINETVKIQTQKETSQTTIFTNLLDRTGIGLMQHFIDKNLLLKT